MIFVKRTLILAITVFLLPNNFVFGDDKFYYDKDSAEEHFTFLSNPFANNNNDKRKKAIECRDIEAENSRPFSSTNRYCFTVKEEGHVILAAYNAPGQLVYAIDCGEVSDNARIYHYPDEYLEHLPSGVYFIIAFFNEKSDKTIKVTYLKSQSINAPTAHYSFDVESIDKWFGRWKRFHNCTLINTTGREENFERPPANYSFSIDSTAQAALLLINNRQEAIRIFFNMELPAGDYTLYHQPIDDFNDPLGANLNYFYCLVVDGKVIIDKLDYTRFDKYGK